jgi:hypothetical protein
MNAVRLALNMEFWPGDIDINAINRSKIKQKFSQTIRVIPASGSKFFNEFAS